MRLGVVRPRCEPQLILSEEIDETNDQPRIGEPLPRAELAYIDPDKLRRYALSRENPLGRHKAEVFWRALNIGADDWEYLRDAVLEALPHRPVSGVREPRHNEEAYTWEVLVPIEGLARKRGRLLQVVTAWEMVEGRPRLVTLRVAAARHQRRL